MSRKDIRRNHQCRIIAKMGIAMCDKKSFRTPERNIDDNHNHRDKKERVIGESDPGDNFIRENFR